MIDRIKRIIEEKGLQASSFAEKIQVSRGAISHILNGRNDPSKDTIEKILNTFPDISPSWLLQGEIPMYNSERIFLQPTFSSSPVQPGLFDEKNTVELSLKSQEYKYSQKNEVKKPENIINSTINQDVKSIKISSKKIEKIMVFFNDKTFMSFVPEE